MTNGRSKSKSRKPREVKIVPVTKERIGKKARRSRAGKQRRVPTQNAFSVSAGYNKKDGWGGKLAYTSDAYDVKPVLGVRGRARLGALGQGVNEFGQHNPNKDTIVPFNELLGTIVGSTGFALTSFDINPGQSGTFPQTSIEAALYERYNFLSLEFYLTPLVTTFTSGGKILMSCDLEGAEEPDPTTVALMENNTIHSDGMPHQTMGFELAGVVRHLESWYTRVGVYPGGADPRLYDVGKLYVATYGNPAALAGQPIAELRVRGSVKLMDKLSEPTGIAMPRNLSQFSSEKAALTFGVFTYVDWSVPSGVDVITSSGWAVAPGNLGLVAPKLTSYYKVTVSALYFNVADTQLFRLRLTLNGTPVAGEDVNHYCISLAHYEVSAVAANLDQNAHYTGSYTAVIGFVEDDVLGLQYIVDGSNASSRASFVVCIQTV